MVCIYCLHDAQSNRAVMGFVIVSQKLFSSSLSSGEYRGYNNESNGRNL